MTNSNMDYKLAFYYLHCKLALFRNHICAFCETTNYKTYTEERILTIGVFICHFGTLNCRFMYGKCRNKSITRNRLLLDSVSTQSWK